MNNHENNRAAKRSKFGEVSASVSLQVWMHDYAMTYETVEFECGRALDLLPLDRVKKLECGTAGYDTDEVFAMAVIAGLVEDHDGPFDCYICDDDELASYIEAREAANATEADELEAEEHSLGKCPKCGDVYNVDCCHETVDGDELLVWSECGNCGHQFIEVFKLVRIEEWKDRR